MSAQHTQGQWAVGYPAGGITGPTASPLVWWHGHEVGYEVITVDSRVIAIVARDGGLEDEDRDNARLIAAAPALLKAATRALNILKAQGNTVQRGNALDALSAAITAATGSQP